MAEEARRRRTAYSSGRRELLGMDTVSAPRKRAHKKSPRKSSLSGTGYGSSFRWRKF